MTGKGKVDCQNLSSLGVNKQGQPSRKRSGCFLLTLNDTSIERRGRWSVRFPYLRVVKCNLLVVTHCLGFFGGLDKSFSAGRGCISNQITVLRALLLESINSSLSGMA